MDGRNISTSRNFLKIGDLARMNEHVLPSNLEPRQIPIPPAFPQHSQHEQVVVPVATPRLDRDLPRPRTEDGSVDQVFMAPIDVAAAFALHDDAHFSDYIHSRPCRFANGISY